MIMAVCMFWAGYCCAIFCVLLVVLAGLSLRLPLLAVCALFCSPPLVCCDCRFIYRRWCLGHQGLVFVGGEQNKKNWLWIEMRYNDSLLAAVTACVGLENSWTKIKIKIKDSKQ